MKQKPTGTVVSTNRSSGVPEGIHRFVIADYEEKEGPSGPYWAYTLVVDEDSPFDGTKVWLNVSLSEAARWKLDEFLDAFEVDEGLDITGEYFVGEYFRGKVEKKEGNNGKMQANIVAFLPDAEIKKAPPKPVAKPKKAAPPPPEEDEDDEDQDGGSEEDDDDDAPPPPPVKKPAGKMPADVKGKTSKFKRPF